MNRPLKLHSRVYQGIVPEEGDSRVATKCSLNLPYDEFHIADGDEEVNCKRCLAVLHKKAKRITRLLKENANECTIEDLKAQKEK